MNRFAFSPGLGRWCLGLFFLGASLTATAQVQHPIESFSAGGGRSSGGQITMESAFGGIGGVSSVSSGLGTLLTQSSIFGQLSEAIRLELSADPDVLSPGQFSQIRGVAYFDDGTQALLSGSEISWIRFDFPLVSITPGGIVTAATPASLISSNSLAEVEGQYLGNVGKVSVLVVPSEKPLILTPPQPVMADAGSSVRFLVEAAGIPPLTYQWFWKDSLIHTATNADLQLASITTENAGLYTVQVSNAYGVASSSATLGLNGVTSPTVETRPPAEVVTTLGSVIRLEVTLSGEPPFSYQWRLNGRNLEDRPAATEAGELTARGSLSGATNSVLTIVNAQLADAGVYSVVVGDQLGTMLVEPIAVTFTGLEILPATIASDHGNGVASNRAASPVRFEWHPNITGIATVTTAGSGFDTTLAVQELTVPAVAVVADDDSGGFRTSLARFNVVQGRRYELAVDGFAGATGDILLQWSIDPAADVLPRILQQPTNVWVLLSTNSVLADRVEFFAEVETTPAATFSWQHNGGSPIETPGPRLVITNVTRSDLGQYQLGVVEGSLPPVFSELAQLEAGTQTNLISGIGDKGLYDTNGAVVPEKVIAVNLLETLFQPPEEQSAGGRWRPASVSGGIISGVQLTVASGELNKKYFGFTIDVKAKMTFDSGGSAVPSSVFVGTGPAYAFGSYQSLGLTNIAGPDQPYTVQFEAQPGIHYWVETFPPDRRPGLLQLNWKAELEVDDYDKVLLRSEFAQSAVIYHAKNGIEEVAGVYSQVRSARARNSDSLLTQVDFSVSADQTRTAFAMEAGKDYWVVVSHAPGAPPVTTIVWDSPTESNVPPTLGFTRQPELFELAWFGSNWRLQMTNRLDQTATPWVNVPPTNNTIRFLLNESSQFFRLVPLPW